MNRRALMIVPLLIVFALGVFITDIQADNEDQPLDDEFVEALVMMAVNHNMMEGENELTHLSALHDPVSSYYVIRIFDKGAMDAAPLKAKQEALLAMIEDEMAIKSNLGLLSTFLTIFTDEEAIDITRESMGLKRFVSGSDDPPGDYFKTMNSLIMTDFETQVNLLLDIDTITILPNLTDTINDHSVWSLNVPAINDSYARIAAVDDADAQTGATIVGDSSTASTNDEFPNKPVRFVNKGYEPVTVVVGTYIPSPGFDPAVPSASTVIFPGSNTSAYLELPQGIYSFCYYWQLDKDSNNDGVFDYHHYSTDIVAVGNTAPDNIESALSVTLKPDTSVGNPNGKCGEDLVPIYTPAPNAPAPVPVPVDPAPGPVDTGGLTPAEAANEGTHVYYVSKNDGTGGYTETITNKLKTASPTILFHSSGFEDPLVRDGNNQYTFSAYGSGVYTITFSNDGFTLAYDESAPWFYTLQD